MTRYHPKGSMCTVCVNRLSKCCYNFKSMPPMGKEKDGIVIVKCTEFKR